MDGTPTKLTTSFIPSLATDNPLYDQEKIDRLESQTADLREKLLRGCWCSLEGAYFKFLRPSYVVPCASVGEQWWHVHIIGLDYGYGNSAAAAGLYFVSEPSLEYPYGQMFKIGEVVEHAMGSVDFAELTCQRFAVPTLQGGNRRKIVAAYCDPANDAHTGAGRSNFDIMADVLQKYDIPMVKASKGRVGNFQFLYNMLQLRWLTLCDTAPKAYKSLSTRIYDPKKSGDIKKVDGDELDDVLDETAYAVNTYWERSAKPREVKNAETIQKYRDQGMDEHSLNIYQMKMLMEAKNDDGPTKMGSRRALSLRRR